MRNKVIYNSRINIEKFSIEYFIWLAGILLGALAVIGIVLVHAVPIRISDVGRECWIHRTGGIYCPGCGMTRAIFALIHGRVLLSAWYHPVVLYAAVLYGVFMVRGMVAVCSRGKLPFMRWRLGYAYAGVAIIIVQFFAKNILLLGFHLQWMP